MYLLALQNDDRKRAYWLTDKKVELARCFEMGEYYEVSDRLELAALEKDADTVLDTMEAMLSNVERLVDFRNAPLYEHMEFKELSEEFLAGVRENLLKCFRDEETYGFLKNDRRWKELVRG